MSEPQFIPSSTPHSVEVAEGSHVAKSKSANVGTEVRQNAHDKFAHEQDIQVQAHQIMLNTSAAGADNMVKKPRADSIERASKALAPSGARERAVRGINAPASSSASGSANTGLALERPVYDTEIQEMNFPARVIHLRVENDAVRAQLADLQSLMGEQATIPEDSK